MRWVMLGLALALASCAEPGSLALRFSLEPGLEASLDGAWAHLQARDADGGVLASRIAPAAGLARLSLDLPHGEGRRVFLELRDGPSPSGAAVLAYGASAPFDLRVDEVREVEVVVPVRAVARLERLEALGARGGAVRAARVELAITASRADLASAVIAQDPGLSFGRARVELEGQGVERRLSYDLDTGCGALGGCPDGRRSLFVQLWDAAGYPSVTTSTVIRLDRAGPALAPGSTSIRFEAAGALVDPVAAGAGVRVELGFALDEGIAGPPEVRLEGSDLAFELAGESRGAWRFTRVIGDEDADGAHVPVVTATDLAGNTARIPLGLDYLVDRSAPAPAAVDTPGRVLYERRPWGEARGGPPRFAVRGASGAVEPGARVVVFDRAELFVDGALGAVQIGRATADADGAFEVELVPVDRPRVHVLVVDEAGNLSGPTADLVRDVRLFVPAGADDGPPTPTELRLLDRRPASLRTDGLGVSAPDPGPLGTVDGRTVSARYRPRWSEWTSAPSPSPPPRRLAGLAWDPARERAVLFGGRTASEQVLLDTWEWDGRAWSAVPLSGAEPTCMDGTAEGDTPAGAVAHHPGAGATLVVCRELAPRQPPPLPPGGADTLGLWGWDGVRWTRRSASGAAPPGRSGHAVAYDPARGALVLFGGNAGSLLLPGAGATALADTWALQASPPGADAPLFWRPITTPLAPPARDRHAMVYDPVRREILLFGGFTAPRASIGSVVGKCAETPSNGVWTPVSRSKRPLGLSLKKLRWNTRGARTTQSPIAVVTGIGARSTKVSPSSSLSKTRVERGALAKAQTRRGWPGSSAMPPPSTGSTPARTMSSVRRKGPSPRAVFRHTHRRVRSGSPTEAKTRPAA